MEATPQISYEDYVIRVFDYLEYIGYPDVANFFWAEAIADAVRKTSVVFHADGMSHRSCALSIFGHTWYYQIHQRRGTIH